MIHFGVVCEFDVSWRSWILVCETHSGRWKWLVEQPCPVSLSWRQPESSYFVWSVAKKSDCFNDLLSMACGLSRQNVARKSAWCSTSWTDAVPSMRNSAFSNMLRHDWHGLSLWKCEEKIPHLDALVEWRVLPQCMAPVCEKSFWPDCAIYSPKISSCGTISYSACMWWRHLQANRSADCKRCLDSDDFNLLITLQQSPGLLHVFPPRWPEDKASSKGCSWMSRATSVCWKGGGFAPGHQFET